MKLSLLSTAFVAVALCSGQASALTILGGNACDPLGNGNEPDYYRLDGGYHVLGPNNFFGYVSCPMANTENSGWGLESGWVRVRATNIASACAMRAMSSFGSVLSGTAVWVTTLNTDLTLNVGQSVTSSAVSGYFSLSCSLSGGSRLYSYRYTEAT